MPACDRKALIMSDVHEFHCAFEVSRMVIFEVSYSTLGSNEHPYFSTCACEFNHQKTGWNRCGQAQGVLLRNGVARRFWERWDARHLSQLTDEEFVEMRSDLDALKARYNFVEEENVEDSPHNGENLRFSTVRDLSRLPLKRPAAKASAMVA